jgi:hypothetical protein
MFIRINPILFPLGKEDEIQGLFDTGNIHVNLL